MVQIDNGESLQVIHRGFPGGSVVKNPHAMQEMLVPSLGQENSMEEETGIHSSILAGQIPWTEELVGYSPWGHKEWDMTERLSTPTQGHTRSRVDWMVTAISVV